MSKYGIGQPVTRFEDPRLLRGQGRFINDVNMHGQAYAVFVRSPHAHAKIRSIDIEAAKSAPGVVAVYTGHDVKADGLGMPKAPTVSRCSRRSGRRSSPTACAMSAIRWSW
jgi:carbon-monoxide dehydrogenase large subunit